MSDTQSGDNANGAAQGSSINYQIPGWQSGLPEAYRGDPLLRDMEVPGKLFEAYRDAHGKLSKFEGRQYIPGKEATAEEWTAYRKAMGVPDSKDGYKFNVPDNVDKNSADAIAEWVRDIAVTEGLPAETTARIYDRWIKDSLKATEEQHKAQREQAKAATEELQKKYGEKWSTRVTNAKNFVKTKLGETVYNDMVQKNLFDNPVYLDSFATLHEALGEDSLPSNGSVSGGAITEKNALEALFPTMVGK